MTDNLHKSAEAKFDINVPSASNVPGTSSNLTNHKITNIKSNTVSSSSNLAASLNNAKASGGGHFFKSKNDNDSDEEAASFNNNNRISGNHVNNSNGGIEAALLDRNQNVSFFIVLNNF